MTEFDTFQNGTAALLMEAPPPSPINELPLPRVDAERGVFITSRGNEVQLSGQVISSLMLERVTNEGRPKIPHQEVTLLGKHKELHANPNDPGYIALLNEWQNEQNVRVLRYVFVVGTKGLPPPDFVEAHRQFLPDATDLDMKYLWVSSLIPDEDIDQFTSAILGKGLTTQKGLEEAANFSA